MFKNRETIPALLMYMVTFSFICIQLIKNELAMLIPFLAWPLLGSYFIFKRGFKFIDKLQTGEITIKNPFIKKAS
jgi:hypothetical protein